LSADGDGDTGAGRGDVVGDGRGTVVGNGHGDGVGSGRGTGLPGGRPGPVRVGRLELLGLLAILVLAALTRLPGIDERGRWDADQGTDMVVLHDLATDGTMPLLGPRTSIGTFHHGAVYYYLLAPAALVSGADPVAVTVEIALFGIAAVAGTWWLARLVGGPLAAVAAGLLAAISPAGIDESTFIWNPNLIPAAAALALAAALVARRSGRARWWAASGLGVMVVMQCHVLGAVLVVPLAAWWVLDLVRRRRAGGDTSGTVRGGLAAVAIIAAGYLPLLISELGTGFAETRGILEYVAGGGRGGGDGLAGTAVMVGLRSMTWPLAGLITDRIGASLLAALVLAALVTIAVAGRRRPPGATPQPAGVDGSDLPAARWLVAAFGFSVLALAVFAPSLAVVVPELPNDHYHAFLDPIVLALAGVGIARLAHGALGAGSAAGPAGPRARSVGRVMAGVIAVTLAAIAVPAWPPAVSPDGGWPLADEAAARVLEVTGSDPFALNGIPDVKNANALGFPLMRRGAPLLPEAAAAGAATLVIVCDPVFDDALGVACGGASEDAWLAAAGRTDLVLVERFESGPRRVISIYATHARLAARP
jgi:hypothetical protein